MQFESFSYELPLGRIAQRPVRPYDAAKLLVLERGTGRIIQTVFSALDEMLGANDILVFNNTRVIPARLHGEIKNTGAGVEIFLLKEESPDKWLCLARPLKKLKAGLLLNFAPGLEAEVLEKTASGEARLEFRSSKKPVKDLIFLSGRMPIPPYVRKGKADEADKTDYQTIFAARDGSIAAPTASLHFTVQLLKRIKQCGCGVEDLTLHVGASSIRPLWREGQAESWANQEQLGSEKYEVRPELMELCRLRRSLGGRVIAVGTTVVRALESAALHNGALQPLNEETSLFIRPGFKFKLIDAVITNFHQPHTSHLLLVEAFIGSRGLLSEAYRYALGHDFRFLSYGDGMLIL